MENKEMAKPEIFDFAYAKYFSFDWAEFLQNFRRTSFFGSIQQHKIDTDSWAVKGTARIIYGSLLLLAQIWVVKPGDSMLQPYNLSLELCCFIYSSSDELHGSSDVSYGPTQLYRYGS